jgi:hypothetical protein
MQDKAKARDSGVEADRSGGWVRVGIAIGRREAFNGQSHSEEQSVAYVWALTRTPLSVAMRQNRRGQVSAQKQRYLSLTHSSADNRIPRKVVCADAGSLPVVGRTFCSGKACCACAPPPLLLLLLLAAALWWCGRSCS